MENQALTTEQIRYRYTEKDKQASKHTELVVNKIENTINAIVQEQDEQSEKISRLDMTAKDISLQVSDKLDLTKIDRSNGHTITKECMSGPLINLRIYGNNKIFDNELYVSDTSILDDKLLLGRKNKGNYVMFKHLVDDERAEIIDAYIDTDGQLIEDTTGNSKTLIIRNKVEDTELVDLSIVKQAGKRFRYAIYDYDDIGSQAKSYIIKDTEEIIETKIGGEDDYRYIAVNYWDGTQDNITEERLFKSLELVYTADTQILDLNEITSVLRQFEDVEDEYVYDNGKSYVIRRIGVYDDGTLYKLALEEIQRLEDADITMKKGTNKVDILGYTADMALTYIPENDTTKTFTTTYDVQSMIKLLENQITLLVQSKLDKGEIIAEINLEIDNEDDKSAIQIKSNKLSIDSDKFKLTNEGDITAISGTIGGWRIEETKLEKGLAGISGVDSSNASAVTFYAGKGLGRNNGNKFQVNNNGDVIAQSMYIYDKDTNANTAFIKLYKPNGNVTTTITSSSIDTYDVYAGSGGRKGLCMHGYNTSHNYMIDYKTESGHEPFFSIYVDGESNEFPIPRTQTSIEQKVYILYRNQNLLALTGYNWTYACAISPSDRRLKHDISDTKVENALDYINGIRHREFTWNESGEYNKLGYIAQELEEVNPDFVNKIEQPKSAEYEYLYQVDTFKLLPYLTKSIQELSKQVTEQQKKIDAQQEAITTLFREIEKLKGENNGND